MKLYMIKKANDATIMRYKGMNLRVRSVVEIGKSSSLNVRGTCFCPKRKFFVSSECDIYTMDIEELYGHEMEVEQEEEMEVDQQEIQVNEEEEEEMQDEDAILSDDSCSLKCQRMFPRKSSGY